MKSSTSGPKPLHGLDGAARTLHQALFDILAARLEESGLTVTDINDGSYAGGEVEIGGQTYKILVVPPNCDIEVVHRLICGEGGR